MQLSTSKNLVTSLHFSLEKKCQGLRRPKQQVRKATSRDLPICVGAQKITVQALTEAYIRESLAPRRAQRARNKSVARARTKTRGPQRKRDKKEREEPRAAACQILHATTEIPAATLAFPRTFGDSYSLPRARAQLFLLTRRK